MAINPSNYMYQSPAEQRLIAMQQQNPQLAQQFNMNYPYQPQLQSQYQNPMMVQPQQYMQSQVPVQNQSIVFECRPVTSIDEAKASPPKWDGSPTISVDSSNKCVYEKKLNPNDGSSIFNIYKLVENKAVVGSETENISKETVAYVDKKEFDDLQAKVILLTANHKKLYDELMGDVGNGIKSNADDASTSRKWQPDSDVAKYGKRESETKSSDTNA